jgi:hypothetical protein
VIAGARPENKSVARCGTVIAAYTVRQLLPLVCSVKQEVSMNKL